MFCGKCGAKNTEGCRFCVKCGAQLNREENTSPHPLNTDPPGTVTESPVRSVGQSNRRIVYILAGVVILIVAVFLIGGGRKNPEEIIPGTWYAPEGNFYEFDGKDITFYSDGSIDGWVLEWSVVNGNILRFNTISWGREDYFTIVKISKSKMTLRDNDTGETIVVLKR